jgi:hypothetical protein
MRYNSTVSRTSFVARGSALLTFALFAAACGSSGNAGDAGGASSGTQGTGSGAGASTGGTGGSGGSGGGGGAGATGGTGIIFVDSGGFGDGAGGTYGVEPDGAVRTGCATLNGTVYTPGKTDPLYNAIVYIATGNNIDPIASGASCDKCGTLSAAKALTATLTGPDGKFSLRGVPLGTNLPLVIQLGKWRRVVRVDVASCSDVDISDELTRLPRNQSEGDIPLTAISTGGADTLECILRKMGIDDAEFTVPAGPGRIHMYHATGAKAATGTTPEQTALWSDLATLKKYDVVLLPCEHAANTAGKAPGYTNLVDYTTAGGRVFVTHYNYTWIRTPTTLFPATANWTGETKYFGTDYDFPMNADVDTTFPKGKDFAQWLVNVGASQTYGSIQLDHVVHNSDSVIASVAQSWLTSPSMPRQYKKDGSMITQQIQHHYTFNTPVGVPAEQQCGRVVYSAFHVNDASSDDKVFPTECNDKPLTPQEKVLMFMLFDLASCVQTDRKPPVPPIIIK